MKCATHPGRSALGYCARCGKALCKDCLVRLSTGNYCETCANTPERAARPGRGLPWWAIALIIVAAVIVLRALIH
jgi:B-box zinc finger